MSRDWLALRAALAAVAHFAVTLGMLWLLIAGGVTRFVVPPPETTAEQFLRALKAHNFDAAADQLSEEARREVDAEQLHEATQRLVQRSGSIADAHGGQAEEQGQTATAEATVVLGDQSEHTLQFLLVREQGVWKVSSVESLLALAGE